MCRIAPVGPMFSAVVSAEYVINVLAFTESLVASHWKTKVEMICNYLLFCNCPVFMNIP